MNKKILQILEYDKVKEQFMNALTTAQGQQELKDLKPLTDKEKIQLLFDEVADFRLLTQENGLLNLGKTNDLTEILRRLELEASLSGKEFVEIKKVIQLGINIQRFFDEAENVETPSLAITLEKLVDLSALVKKLEIFDNAGSLYDNASLELMHIRASIKSHQSEIRKIMQEMLTKNLSSLSENVITIRNDRQVLPVKAENKNKISGVVHDMSASGQTLYIEPNAVVSLNNKLNQKRIEERQEITRIYRDLASQLKPYSFDIRQNAWLIGHIDFVRAKYLYLAANKATLPELTTDKDITLFAARHPLIEAKTVVANDIKFDENKITVSFPYLDKEQYYGVDKKEAVQKYKDEGYTVYFVGDGPSDYRAIEVADFSFVRKGTRAIKFCQENEIDFFEFENFDEILNYLKKQESK